MPLPTTEKFRSTEALYTWYSHISEQPVEVYLYEHQITFYSTFPLDIPEKHIHGIRDEIKTFSQASRLRLMKFLASLPYSILGVPFFVTLTYHNYVPGSMHLVKRDLHDFFIDLKRHYPSVKYLWKLEFQKRGAPHFHLVLFVPEKIVKKLSYKFKKDLYYFWEKHLNCGCYWCQQHAVKVQKIHSFKKLSFYVSKYMAKVDDTMRPEGTGRFWGRSNDLKELAVVKASCDLDTFYKLRDRVIEIIKSRNSKFDYYSDYVKDKFSFFVFLSDSERNAIISEFFPDMRARPTPSAAGVNLHYA